MSADLSPLVRALADRAEELCVQLIPSGRIESGEFVASGGETGFGAIGVVLKGAKRGRVGFWAGRPDAPEKEGGDLLHLIMAANRLPMRQAIDWAQKWLGGAAVALPPPVPREERDKSEESLKRWKREKAQAMIANAFPLNRMGFRMMLAERHPAIVYLHEARGITLELQRLTGDVRYAPRLEYWKGATREADGRRRPGPAFPAIVCAIRQPDGTISAAHCTFLHPKGFGKAEVPSPKLMMGDVAGGIITLQQGKPGGHVIGNEGLENGLTAMMAHDGTICARVAPSVSSIRHLLAGLDRPAGLILCPHNDWTSQAATDAYLRARRELEKSRLPIAEWRAGGEANDLNDMVRG